MIHHGDCYDYLSDLAANSVDHVITDPPYSQHVHDNSMGGAGVDVSASRDLGFDHITEAQRRVYAQQFVRVAKRWILVFSDHEGSTAWRRAIEEASGEFVRYGIWVKRGATPQFTGDRPAVGHEVIVIAYAPDRGGRMRWNGGGRHAVWEVSVARNESSKRHPTQKPLTLMQALIRDFTDQGETILDPFAGSGTTLVAAKQLGRSPVGCEQNKEWVDVCVERLGDCRAQGDLFAGSVG